MIFGAVYVPDSDSKIKKMLILAKPNKKERIVDMGSGKGIILIELVKRGFKSEGLEINPLLVK